MTFYWPGFPLWRAGPGFAFRERSFGCPRQKSFQRVDRYQSGPPEPDARELAGFHPLYKLVSGKRRTPLRPLWAVERGAQRFGFALSFFGSPSINDAVEILLEFLIGGNSEKDIVKRVTCERHLNIDVIVALDLIPLFVEGFDRAGKFQNLRQRS